MSTPVSPDARWLWENEPCRAACPVHTDAGAYVTAIAEGRFRDAYTIARRPNPFPSICGRVCAAPCETACRRGKVDAPIAIRALKRFVDERFGVESDFGPELWHEAHAPVPAVTSGSVGIIGGGVGGLSAAHDLRLAGHAVTVYEADERLGGMVLLGIPEYRLPREIIAAEIAAIVSLGVEVRLGCRVGRDITFEEILAQHDAVFVAAGAWQARGLDIPGNEQDGVLKAVEFLLNVNQGYKVDLGERVVVVGGGNVAFDAARTALRAAARDEATPGPVALGERADQDALRDITTTMDVARAARRAGVRDVTVIALESADELPAALEEVEEAELEGIKLIHRRGPHCVLGDGRVTGLETIDVLSVFDGLHRFAPVFAPDTEKVLPADTVILAVGQASDTTFIPAEMGLDRTRFGGLAVDGSLRTTHPKVWAGGDVAFGPRNLIDAIGDGQRAAASIHEALTGAPARPRNEVKIELITKPEFRRVDSEYDGVPRVAVPSLPADRRIGFTEVEHGYTLDGAMREGFRCLRCFDNIMLKAELCILCGLCVDVCPENCITIVRADNIGAGTAAQSALVLDEEVCIRCGLCINRCPPAALVMVHAKEITND
jgi:NADPH-dependent glutamate synthase beta subunit-like oxidoreductase/ferredoxin